MFGIVRWMRLVDERQDAGWTHTATRSIQTWQMPDGYVVAWRGPAGRGRSRTWPQRWQALEVVEWLMAAAGGEWWRLVIEGVWPASTAGPFL